MRFTYDDEADAVYVYVLEGSTVASSEVLDDGRVIDLHEGGHLIGVEMLEASQRGVRLADLIERFQLESVRAKLRNLEDRFRPVEHAYQGSPIEPTARVAWAPFADREERQRGSCRPSCSASPRGSPSSLRSRAPDT